MRQRQATSLMLLALYALLIVALLVLTVAGARLYGAAVERQRLHREQRGALAYIQSQAALCEGKGGIRLESREGDTVLCLREWDADFETWIYPYEGTLRSQLVHPKRNFFPEAGERICDLEHFEARWESARLLTVTVDGREGYICCGGGGDA